jgi:FixJ family two-component response regulator
MQAPAWIYVIEDEESNAKSLAMLLELARLPARHFHSADEFLSEVGTLSPGCVLMDVDLPGTSGIEALEELDRRGLDWPAVIMTGYSAYDLEVGEGMLDRFEVLEKPFDRDALLEAVQRSLAALPS